VVAAGPIEVYAARGSYQIVVERLAPQGIGPLELAFRQLYEKLAAEGLFRPERKRPLPRFPRRIALVTSPVGAAVRDLLQVITRRWPACDIIIVPVPVQGAAAAPEIAAAIGALARLPHVDVVITGRGGGSLEDLWAFNEESVARAIFHCPIPVVSAVGHEVDVTIADLVADKRALTPSEAGELVVPQRAEVLSDLEHLATRMRSALQHGLRRRGLLVDALAASRALARPLEIIHDRGATDRRAVGPVVPGDSPSCRAGSTHRASGRRNDRRLKPAQGPQPRLFAHSARRDQGNRAARIGRAHRRADRNDPVRGAPDERC